MVISGPVVRESYTSCFYSDYSVLRKLIFLHRCANRALFFVIIYTDVRWIAIRVIKRADLLCRMRGMLDNSAMQAGISKIPYCRPRQYSGIFASKLGPEFVEFQNIVSARSG